MPAFTAHFSELIDKTDAEIRNFINNPHNTPNKGHSLVLDLHTFVWKSGLQNRTLFSPELEALVSSIENDKELQDIISSLYKLFDSDTRKDPNSPTQILASPVTRKLNYLNEHYNKSSGNYIPFKDVIKIFDKTQNGNPALILHKSSIEKLFPLLDLYYEHRSELYLINGGYTFDLNDHVSDLIKITHDIYAGTLSSSNHRDGEVVNSIRSNCRDFFNSIKTTISTSNIIRISHDKVSGEAIKVIDLYSSDANIKKLALIYKFLDKATINVMITQPRHIYTIVDFLKVQIIETIKTHGFHNILNVFTKAPEVDLVSADGATTDPYEAGKAAMKALLEPHVKYAEFNDKYTSLVDKNKMDLPSAPIEMVIELLKGESVNIPSNDKEDSMFTQMVNLNRRIHQIATVTENEESFVDVSEDVREAAKRLVKLIGIPDTLKYVPTPSQEHMQLYNSNFKPLILLIFLSIFENTFEPIKTDKREVYSQDNQRSRKIHNYMIKIGIKPGEVTKILLTNRENPFQTPTKLVKHSPNNFKLVGEQIHGMIANAMNVKGRRVYSSVYQYVIEQLTKPDADDNIDDKNDHEIIMKFYNICVKIKQDINRSFLTTAKPIQIKYQTNKNNLKYSDFYVLQGVWSTTSAFTPAYTELVKSLNKNKGEILPSIPASGYEEREAAIFNILMYNIPIANTTTIRYNPIEIHTGYIEDTPKNVERTNNTIDEYLSQDKISDVGFVLFPVNSSHSGPPSLTEQGTFTDLTNPSKPIDKLNVNIPTMDKIDQRIFLRNIRLLLGL